MIPEDVVNPPLKSHRRRRVPVCHAQCRQTRLPTRTGEACAPAEAAPANPAQRRIHVPAPLARPHTSAGGGRAVSGADRPRTFCSWPPASSVTGKATAWPRSRWRRVSHGRELSWSQVGQWLLRSASASVGFDMQVTRITSVAAMNSAGSWRRAVRHDRVAVKVEVEQTIRAQRRAESNELRLRQSGAGGRCGAAMHVQRWPASQRM